MAELQIENTGDTFHLAIGDAAELSWSQGLFTLSLSKEAGFGRTMRYLQLEKLEHLHILMDTSSLELFFNNGERVMSTRFYPQNAEKRSRILTFDGSGSVQLYALKPMTFQWSAR